MKIFNQSNVGYKTLIDAEPNKTFNQNSIKSDKLIDIESNVSKKKNVVRKLLKKLKQVISNFSMNGRSVKNQPSQCLVTNGSDVSKDYNKILTPTPALTSIIAEENLELKQMDEEFDRFNKGLYGMLEKYEKLAEEAKKSEKIADNQELKQMDKDFDRFNKGLYGMLEKYEKLAEEAKKSEKIADNQELKQVDKNSGRSNQNSTWYV